MSLYQECIFKTESIIFHFFFFRSSVKQTRVKMSTMNSQGARREMGCYSGLGNKVDEDICGQDGKVIHLFLTFRWNCQGGRSGVQKRGLDLRQNSRSHHYIGDIQSNGNYFVKFFRNILKQKFSFFSIFHSKQFQTHSTERCCQFTGFQGPGSGTWPGCTC